MYSKSCFYDYNHNKALSFTIYLNKGANMSGKNILEVKKSLSEFTSEMFLCSSFINFLNAELTDGRNVKESDVIELSNYLCQKMEKMKIQIMDIVMDLYGSEA